ncbi:hypothetical protein [Gordonia terrae]|uniref:Uncharacterized protein n=2 Tax=Gordonia terrae TaxID=2055 RepID=A0AAD0K8Y6_9ACTN|nr:hypothetical protein [Gordonia terrae]VTR10850.1 Uncharacterised protein [Clostridioides difficile]ANY24398.1 hypothetical protein BCM27_17770 [Gordonia terrae]AWO85145.1 hypothetical protein DLJ61_17960 [Gordonia terrae]VTS58789.1 Uncharacterised protein [Gordonia terrae]GAB46776.1 hypothetical protein GOTRE_181_00560 [Gordonia terrae NBRC 100016]
MTDDRPTARRVLESARTGRGSKRHRHTEFAAENGARIVVTRYANSAARVTVFSDGSRREFRESSAGDDRWLLAAVGYRLEVTAPV